MKLHFRRTCLVLPGLLLAITTVAAPAATTSKPNTRSNNPLSLGQAIGLALSHNPRMEVGAARGDAAAARAHQAGLWENPEVEVFTEDMPLRSGTMNQSKTMAGISQVIPYAGKKPADRAAGAAGVAVSKADWNASRVDLVRDVKLAFYAVESDERAVAVATELVDVATTAASAAAKRSAVGDSPLQEQLRAEIVVAEAKAAQQERMRDVAVARQELARLLGRPDLADVPLVDAITEPPNNNLLDSNPLTALESHPSLVAAKARRDQAVAQLRRAGLEAMPDLKVGVEAGRDGSSNENIIGLRLSLPLPLFDRGKGKQQEAQAAVREAEADITATRLMLLGNWRAAIARFRNAANQVRTHHDEVLPKSNRALELVQTGFDAGKLGLIDLLDVQRTAAEARFVYQKKLYELNAAKADLEALIQPPGQAAK